ncbi:MAG: hypothetical protein BRD45_03255 [Bacteroidetes bacterium QS_8_64_10]|jgi:hypothetical protein|nr:MAG: hypothetical protein BRD40_03875 [Bacteroidetes bacterium QS_1_65_9]PSQ89407.1 MAG: hypothetical protein BRD45_03255 [Bacteroidetes bacterium QS_8_64_10]
MYFTPDRLLLIAVVMTLISADGLYRAWKQHQDEKIGDRLFAFYAGTLGLGSGMTWIGFLTEWL